MPPSYVTIPRSEYQALLKEVKRGVEVCGEVSSLRVKLSSLVGRLQGRVDKPALEELKKTIESCEEVSRLRVELSALERYLREFDQEMTPVRPPSQTDIKAAFDNSVGFSQGKIKAPGLSPARRASDVRFYFESKKDSRFFGTGATREAWQAKEEIARQIAELERKFGVQAPDDIEMHGIKG